MMRMRGSRVLTTFALGWLLGACATSSDAVAQAPEATPPAAALDGPALYRRHCLACHQADGGGVPNMQPPILGSAWVKGAPQPLALFVMTGGFNSASRKESDVGNVMPAFPQLSNEELAALLTYVRQKFGDGTGPVTAADVRDARKSVP
jgi:mono/diheme cytochrome c family protein